MHVLARQSYLVVLVAFVVGCGGGDSGKEGAPALIHTSVEAPGFNCSVGGWRVQSGTDRNRDGTLSSGEVQSVSYICHGVDGRDGSDGTDGEDGQDGQNGKMALTAVTAVAAGIECPTGGYRIDAGIDLDGDAVLNEGEVQSSVYVCHGTDGSSGSSVGQSLIRTLPEAAGANCISGGYKIDSGLDANTNGVLEEHEIHSTVYACHGADGSDGQPGLNALINVSPEMEGDNCEKGGYRVDAGQDSNINGVLDPEEVQNSVYICTVENGSVFQKVGGLNDTGVTACGNYALSGGEHDNHLNCSVVGATATNAGVDSNEHLVPAGQDAHFGRDFQASVGELEKIGAGHAGFDFTKLDGTGDALPLDTSSWECVRDNVTGLVWEIKTNNGSRRDASNTYSWYDPESPRNYGDAGRENGGVCPGGVRCDTDKYISDINAESLCGWSDWRLPNKSELIGIVSFDRNSPAIDTDFFGGTSNDNYWTSSTSIAGSPAYAHVVSFGYGNAINTTHGKQSPAHVRLVRGASVK